MLVALITITPIGITGAFPAMTQPLLLLAGIGESLNYTDLYAYCR